MNVAKEGYVNGYSSTPLSLSLPTHSSLLEQNYGQGRDDETVETLHID